MKTLKKSGLSMAIVAGLVATGMSGISNQAQAMPQLAEGVPHVAVDGLGQALIFPYYTVRNGFASLFNITNTSGDTLAIKVRVREGFNSRDALDFNIILSPYDVWTGWIEDGDDGPLFKSTDKSCVSGAPWISTTGQPLVNTAYATPGYADHGSADIDRTREGYVEMIVMGKNDPDAPDLPGEANPLDYYAKHVNGIPRDCAIVDSAFVANADPFNGSISSFEDTIAAGGGTNTKSGDGDPDAYEQFVGLVNGDNPLKGNFVVVNKGIGIGGGTAATTIADYNQSQGEDNDSSLITAQSWPWFLEPTLASGSGIWTTTGLPALETALSSVGIANEWAHNPSSGAEVDWTINFPTKSFHVDALQSDLITASTTNILAAVNQWRMGSAALVGAATTAPTGYTGGVFPQYDDPAAGKITITLTGFDREELEKEADTGNTTPSPQPPQPPVTLELPRETNVISFRDTGSELSSQSFVLNFDASAALNGAINGWGSLRLGDNNYFSAPNKDTALPMIGWMYKTRDQGDASLAFGQIIDHAHVEPVPVPVTP